MTTEQLTSMLKDAEAQVRAYRPSPYESAQGSQISTLQNAAEQLHKALYVLLPPRGASGSPTCPHCGRTVTVTLS
jgi:hypothetical protein